MTDRLHSTIAKAADAEHTGHEVHRAAVGCGGRHALGDLALMHVVDEHGTKVFRICGLHLRLTPQIHTD